jgi:glucose-6-phosphate 1-dehydrogenase
MLVQTSAKKSSTRELAKSTFQINFANQIRFKCGDDKKSSFLKMCKYFRGNYDKPEDFAKLHQELEKAEEDDSTRIYYLAIPPTQFVPVAKAIKEKAMSKVANYCGVCNIFLERLY